MSKKFFGLKKLVIWIFSLFNFSFIPACLGRVDVLACLWFWRIEAIRLRRISRVLLVRMGLGHVSALHEFCVVFMSPGAASHFVWFRCCVRSNVLLFTFWLSLMCGCLDIFSFGFALHSGPGVRRGRAGGGNHCLSQLTAHGGLRRGVQIISMWYSLRPTMMWSWLYCRIVDVRSERVRKGRGRGMGDEGVGRVVREGDGVGRGRGRGRGEGSAGGESGVYGGDGEG